MRPLTHQVNKRRAPAALHADARLAGAAACRAAAAAEAPNAKHLPRHRGCMSSTVPGGSSGAELQMSLEVLLNSSVVVLRACSGFAGDSMSVPLAPGLRYTIEVARRSGASTPACGKSPPLPALTGVSTMEERVRAEAQAAQLPGRGATAAEASSGCQGLQDLPVCPPTSQAAAGPLVEAAPSAPASSQVAQPLPDPDRLARMQPLSPAPTAAVSSTDPAAAGQGAPGSSRTVSYVSAVHMGHTPGQRAGMQYMSPTSPGAANASAPCSLGVQESACADLAGCVAGLQRYIAKLNGSNLSGLCDSSAHHAKLESTAGPPCLQPSCQDASGEPADSSAAAHPNRRNYGSTRAGDASSDAEDIRCKGALRCASCAGTFG